MKRCLHCGRPADFSLCGILSTLGVSGRRQKCTASLPLCSACLQRFFTLGEDGPAFHVQKAFQAAFQALTEQSISRTSSCLTANSFTRRSIRNANVT